MRRSLTQACDHEIECVPLFPMGQVLVSLLHTAKHCLSANLARKGNLGPPCWTAISLAPHHQARHTFHSLLMEQLCGAAWAGTLDEVKKLCAGLASPSDINKTNSRGEYNREQALTFIRSNSALLCCSTRTCSNHTRAA